MSIIQQLHEQVSAVCPIAGISIGRLDDKATWRIDFVDAATPQQRAAAAAIVSGFDVAAAQQQDALRDQRRVTDAQELQDARLDNAITALIDATPAQRMIWANNNFPTLTPAERARIAMIMNMIVVSMRPQIR
jgi:hypothetical protein